MFELLFFAAFLATVGALVAAVALVLRRQAWRAARLMCSVGGGLALYFGALIIVSLVAPQRVIALGEEHCFDDWCVAVEEATSRPALGTGRADSIASGTFYVVSVRLSNHARGREQRASSAVLYLLDESGTRHDVSTGGQAALEAERGHLPPLTATIPVGGLLRTAQVFDIPSDATGLSAVIEHPVGFSPGWFVIGDESSILHRPTIVRLP